MTDIRQTPKYAKYLEKIGWVVERIDAVNYFIKKIPIIGAVIKIQHPKQLNHLTIEQLAKKYRAFQIIIEPTDYKQAEDLQSRGYHISKSPYLPSKTLLIDLTKSKKIIFNNFKKDCKRAIKKNSKQPKIERSQGSAKQVLIVKNPSIKTFHENWVKSVGFRRYVPPVDHLIYLQKSFPHDSLFLTSHNIVSSRIDAGAIFLKSTDICYYWQAFTNKEGRTSLSQYGLVWKAILWGKSKGCRIFDFEGIYDTRFPNKSWLGFTHFKKSFGGYEMEYPGTFTKFRLPL